MATPTPPINIWRNPLYFFIFPISTSLFISILLDSISLESKYILSVAVESSAIPKLFNNRSGRINSICLNVFILFCLANAALSREPLSGVEGGGPHLWYQVGRFFSKTLSRLSGLRFGEIYFIRRLSFQGL